METKKCSTCAKFKPISEFTPKKNGKFGVTGRCKECLCEISRINHERNREYYLEKNKEFRRDNPEYHREWFKRNFLKRILFTIKSRAKVSNIPFNLELEDIVIPSHCPALGIPLEISTSGKAEDNSPSIDRIIPSKGYVKGNIVIVSRLANRIKTDATIEQLIATAEFYKRYR